MSHCRLLSVFALIFTAVPVYAMGMNGQPAPTTLIVRNLNRYTQDIVSVNGDKASARPQILLLIENNPTTDIVDRFAPALIDANTFTAVLSTYEDALNAETDTHKQEFIRYNTLKTMLARAAYLPTLARREQMRRATDLAETLAKDNKNDAAIWEATGDLYALKDDTENAAFAYRRMATYGSAPMAFYKTAQAYQNMRNWNRAQSAYEAGIRADATLGARDGGKESRHLLYQGLASLYLKQGRDKDAIQALLLSAQVHIDTDKPYTLRLDIAETLLRRGFARQVRDYADAVLKLTPDDDGAKRLRATADTSI